MTRVNEAGASIAELEEANGGTRFAWMMTRVPGTLLGGLACGGHERNLSKTLIGAGAGICREALSVSRFRVSCKRSIVPIEP